MDNTFNKNPRAKRPEWLKVRAPGGEVFASIKSMMREKSLHTVCEEAHCPNINECWNSGTATFMILGDVCVRNCKFCAVKSGKGLAPDPSEPVMVAESIAKMNLKHAVITSVTRDDLQDGGSTHWAETIRKIREYNPFTTIEVLIPDFKGNSDDLLRVFCEKPDILNHNIETVPRLYPIVRPQANYNKSLLVLKKAKEFGLRTKTGIMVGLGETLEEIIDVMIDLRHIEVKIITIGQYLQPTKEHLPVSRFVTPEEFRQYKRIGIEMGFEHIESAPLVRSSYHAEKQL
jgi:lipoic acid synthetase